MRSVSFAALVAGGLLGAPGPATATEILASIWFPETHPLTGVGYLDWAETVEAASDGELTIDVFTGTALLPPNAHLSGLRDGIAEMTYHAGTYTPSELPEDNVIATLGIGLRDNVVVAAAVADFAINDPAMQAMYDRNGVVFLGSYATPPYILMCREPIETLADIRGKKIRMPSAIHAEWARSVGAAAVNVPSSEMFTGLEKGQVDCVSNAANDLKSRSLWDVAKFVTLIDLGSYFSGWQYAMNASSWQNLSVEERQILLDTLPDVIVDTTLAYTASVAEALREAPEHDVTVVEPASDLQEQLDGFNRDTVRGFAITDGRDRFGLEDAEGLVERFDATYAKWQALYRDVDRGDPEALKRVLRDNLYAKIDVAAYGS